MSPHSRESGAARERELRHSVARRDSQADGSERALTHLHRAVGNQAIGRHLRRGQTVEGSEAAERAANRVADRVLRTSRSDAEPAAGNAEPRQPSGSGVSTAHVLPPEQRSSLQAHVDRDLDDVRLHTGRTAHTATRALGATALTVGTDVLFRRGAYDPESREGQRLLAHELAHVDQQTGPGGVRIQRKDSEEESSHPGQKPSPRAYIDQHSWLFGLDETGLGQDLFVLLWQSGSHGDFVESVLAELEAANRTQVARAFVDAAVGAKALTGLWRDRSARGAYRAVMDSLSRTSERRQHLEKAIEQVETAPERERQAAQERLKQQSGSREVIFYPQDPSGSTTRRQIAEETLKQRSETENKEATTVAIGMNRFDDIAGALADAAAERGGEAFVRMLRLRGHGGIVEEEGVFKAGNAWIYTSDLRENYTTGQFAPYMLDGSTIHFQACSIARGEAGKTFLAEIGRIFFGEEKTGYLKGNTEEAGAMIGIGPAEPRTLRWPADF